MYDLSTLCYFCKSRFIFIAKWGSLERSISTSMFFYATYARQFMLINQTHRHGMVSLAINQVLAAQILGKVGDKCGRKVCNSCVYSCANCWQFGISYAG